MEYFGLNIKKIRQKWGLSQEEFGFLIYATRGMIMQYENRGTKPKRETLKQIVIITGLPLDVLESTELADEDIPLMRQNEKEELAAFRENPDENRDENMTSKRLAELMGETEQRKSGRGKDAPQQNNSSDAELIDLLRKNDEFFKSQYATFNTQVLANLTALITQQKAMEIILNNNLEHTLSIETAQKSLAEALAQETKDSHDRHQIVTETIEAHYKGLPEVIDMLKFIERKNIATMTVVFESLARIEGRSSKMMKKEAEDMEKHLSKKEFPYIADPGTVTRKTRVGKTE